MAKKKKYYVVWRGARTGIFGTWDECKAMIEGFAGAQFKAYESFPEAEAAFKRGYVRPDAAVGGAKSTAGSGSVSKSNIIWDSISVDAACSGNPGRMEYRGVNTRTKEQLFHQGPFEYATNNIGEFLALIHGLAYLAKIGRPEMPIYSDSRTAMAWVRNRKMKSELDRIIKNEEVWVLVDRAVDWMEVNSWNTPILKWETESWGEIPADFGRK